MNAIHCAAGAATLVLMASLAGCGGGSGGGSGSGSDGTTGTTPTGATVTLPAKAYCVINSPYLQIGATPDLFIDGVQQTDSHQPDAASPLELPIDNPGAQPAGACKGNTQYRFGSGIYDITGPIGGPHAAMVGMANTAQIPDGIHTRQYSRAFAIESPCNGRRVMFVSSDLGLNGETIHQAVLAQVAADALLKSRYGLDNIMLSSTHTHEGVGGYDMPYPPSKRPLTAVYGALFNGGNLFDTENFQAIVGGMVEAMRRADANLQAHADTAPIRQSIEQLLNANVNRSPPAYDQNPPEERAKYVDADGHEVNVDKRSLQLNFVRNNGSPVGIINWFGVHPTSMGYHDQMISSDNKGYASLLFERLLGTRYAVDSATPDGADNFVAAFAQTDEGDSIPDLFVFDKDMNGQDGPNQGVPYQYRGGSAEPYDASGEKEATAINGTKQLAMALKQLNLGTPLSGPVDYRFFYVDMNSAVVSDPQILATLTPSAGQPAGSERLYAADPKQTCEPSFGLSVANGGVNGPGPLAAAMACEVDPGLDLYAIRHGYHGLYNGTLIATPPWDALIERVLEVALPIATLNAIPFCHAETSDPGYACQAEKPVLIGYKNGVSDEPRAFQIFRVGNLAIIGLPWEVDTMAGRRIRATVLDALAPAGVDTVVIAGLSNSYNDYLTTREEYATQMYEASSTTNGPWQLAIVQQSLKQLAQTLASGAPAPAGAPVPSPNTDAPPPDPLLDPPGSYGSLVSDVAAAYTQGDTVTASFVSGYPANDLKLMGSYAYVERQDQAGDWQTFAVNGRDPELLFHWTAPAGSRIGSSGGTTPGTAELSWTIPLDTPPGTYRLHHSGVSRTSAAQPAQSFDAYSSSFTVSGTAADCPN